MDEFQDSNAAQYELVRLLALPDPAPAGAAGAARSPSLFVVGDPDQSIYGWRGADMRNMTDAFGKDFPQAQVGLHQGRLGGRAQPSGRRRRWHTAAAPHAHGHRRC